MIVTDPKERDLLLHNTVGRELVIRFPDDNIEISSDNIVSESMSLTRSIIDGKELKFGGCIASQFKIKVIDVDKIQGISADLTGKNIEVSLKQTVRPLLYPSIDLYPSESLFPCGANVVYKWRIFTGKIDSALRQKNRAVREIIAYDDFYSTAKYVYEQMTDFAAYPTGVNLKVVREFMEGVINHPDDTEGVELFNDNTPLTFTLDNTRNSVRANKTTTIDVLSACAELNAAFAVMDTENKLRYIQLGGVNAQLDEEIEYYSDLEWEEYEIAPITSAKFVYGGENDNYYFYPFFTADTLSVYISDNIITKCCSNIATLVDNFFPHPYLPEDNHLFGDLLVYRPYKATLFDYWWLEPGDKISILAGTDDTQQIISYVFSVTLTGIQNIRVKINADGVKYLGKDEINVVQ